MNIITGYRGEPHITAQEDRDINLGLVGKSITDLYVLDVGQKLAADIVSANEIRVKDGVMVMQGCAASIDYGSYDSLSINNGSQGMKRIDVIAAQYEKDGLTNVESMSLVVIEGTPDISTPAVPALTSGNIQSGDSLVQMPLYYVHLDGISIDSVEPQFLQVNSIGGVTSYIDSSIKTIVKTGTITIAAGTTSSPSSTNISVSSEVGNNKLLGAILNLGQQALPYSTSGTLQTWIWHVEDTNKRIVIRNATSAWTNYSYTLIMFVQPR